MPGQYLPFSMPEYQRRLAQVRAAMTRQGIDVLFLEDPSNMAWVTGYDGWSFYVHQGVVVFLDDDPIWWGAQTGRQWCTANCLDEGCPSP